MLRVLLTLVLLGVVQPAFGCSIPVFRYALERWPASKYEFIVVRKGPLSTSDQAIYQKFQDQNRLANLQFKELDVNEKLEPKYQAIVDRDKPPVPGVILRYPETDEKVPSLWSGSLKAESLAGMCHSPARDQLFDRLLLGNTSGILLLLSGDPTADNAVRQHLAAELPKFAERIPQPKITEEGPQLLCDLPVRITFTVVEVKRDGSEAMLVKMLLQSEEGLADVKGPIAFPVFGRGRALTSVHGKDLLNGTELQRSLEYLCRACSCQVKELNPGIDLLIAHEWEAIFGTVRGPEPRELEPAIEPQPTELKSEPLEDDEVATVRKSDGQQTDWRFYSVGAAIILVIVTGFWAFLRRTPA